MVAFNTPLKIPQCSGNDRNGAGRAVPGAKAEWLIWVESCRSTNFSQPDAGS
jgi:hypothetical protein